MAEGQSGTAEVYRFVASGRNSSDNMGRVERSVNGPSWEMTLSSMGLLRCNTTGGAVHAAATSPTTPIGNNQLDDKPIAAASPIKKTTFHIFTDHSMKVEASVQLILVESAAKKQYTRAKTQVYAK